MKAVAIRYRHGLWMIQNDLGQYFEVKDQSRALRFKDSLNKVGCEVEVEFEINENDEAFITSVEKVES